MTLAPLDDAYDRFRSTGPEFGGYLSNHGPMAAEALVRHGHADDVPRWVDTYSRRLEDAPTSSRTIVDWREALGDVSRVGDWLGWFDEQLRERPWAGVLATWWPRLLPGIAAGATHGVIRVGHTVRVLREEGETPERLGELAQGLGYWAARWQPVPRVAAPAGRLSAAAAIASVPAVPEQTGGISSRLVQLQHVDGWESSQRAVAPSERPDEFLREVVTAAVHRYATHAHGDPIMLVHAATAPNAVLRTLPSLPRELWADSAAAAWTASAAVFAAYGPADARPPSIVRRTSADTFDLAAQHGDEHVIKLADTALDVFAWDADDLSLAAVEVAAGSVERL
jgi:hypothetical protein